MTRFERAIPWLQTKWIPRLSYTPFQFLASFAAFALSARIRKNLALTTFFTFSIARTFFRLPIFNSLHPVPLLLEKID